MRWGRVAGWLSWLALAVSLWLLALRMMSPPTGIDLVVYRGAAQALLNGAGLYSPDFNQVYGEGLPFTYPPFAAVAGLPLLLLPGAAALIAWTFGNLLLLVLGVRMWLPQATPATRRAIVALAILLTPVTNTLMLGQLGIAITVGCYWDATRRNRTSGALVGLLAAVKLLPALFMLYFLVTGQWRRLGWSALTFSGATLLGFLIAPSDTAVYLRTLATSTDRVAGDVAVYINQSLLGVLAREGWQSAWLPLAIGITVGVLAMLRGRIRPSTEGMAVTAVGLTTCLVSPISWEHHAVWLVPAILLLWPSAGTAARAAMGLGAAGVFARLPQFGSHVDNPVVALLAENWTFYATALLTGLLLARVVAMASTEDHTPSDTRGGTPGMRPAEQLST